MKKNQDQEEIKIAKYIVHAMGHMAGKYDEADVAYVMALGYIKSQGYRLVGEKIYKKKKHIGDLEKYRVIDKKENKTLELKIRFKNPMYYTIIDFEVDDGQSKNKD